MTAYAPLLAGLALGALAFPLLYLMLRALCVQVEEHTAVLITRFGKHIRTLDRPGLHFYPRRVLPWVQLSHVNRRRDGRRFDGVAVNDARGTTVTLDLWLELRIDDPVRVSFAVDNWEKALPHLVARAATAVLGDREFHEILRAHDELADLLRNDIAAQAAPWGLGIAALMIRDVHVLPGVARELLASINARLERARAEIEERGRLAVAAHDADTSASVAALVAEAKAQYPPSPSARPSPTSASAPTSTPPTPNSTPSPSSAPTAPSPSAASATKTRSARSTPRCSSPHNPNPPDPSVRDHPMAP
jgi:regulator of protease activity HflC (stomatin/prohibitin superfamily)